jgi:plastocyanin
MDRTRLTARSACLLVGLLAATLLASCDAPERSAATHRAPPAPLVTVPRGQDLFAPFILATQPGTKVTWRNMDTAAHSVVTTPDSTAYLNPVPFSLLVPPGGDATFTFSKPGAYDYYDGAAATWNGDDHRVAADRGMPNYPLAMEGVIWVQGRIAGLPATATEPIPARDEFATDFLAVRVGGTVAWYNADTDDHDIVEVPGWGGPVNPARLAVGELDGTDAAPPNGATKVATFATPGLYYYFCAIHAHVEATWHRAAAHADASDTPIPMEGFVLVAPS